MTDVQAPESRVPRTPLHIFAVVTAFMLPVVFSPNVASYFWLPKAAYLLVVTGVGLPLLAQLVIRERQWLARAAALFLVVEALSAILSSNHTYAFFGGFAASDGWLFWAGAISAWAIGRSVGSHAEHDLVYALLAGVAVNAAVAIGEMVFDLEWYHLTLFDGRSPGLMGNPVHLSALLAGCLGLVTSSRIRIRTAVPLTALFTAGLQVAGGRLGLAVGVVVLMVGLLRRQRVFAAALAGAAVVGLLLGAAAVRAKTGASAASSQLSAEPAGGIRDRVENWKSAASAIADRPILGSGPDRFQAATSRYRSLRLARSGPDRVYEDAHNLVINLLVTVGVIGAGLFLAFFVGVVVAARDRRSPLALFAFGVLVTHLLEPGLAGTTPLALLCLGVLGAELPAVVRRPTAMSAVALGLVGTMAAAAALFGGFELEQARLDYRMLAINRANDFLPRWSNTAGLKARIHLFNGRLHHDPVELRASVRWREEAARRDPANPSLWNDLGDVLAGQGQYDRAVAAYKKALPLNPWSVRALANIALVDVVAGRPAAGRPYVDKALRVADSARLRALRDATREGGGSTPPPSG